MTVAAVIVAAGSGQRAGGEVPKQYQKLNGRAVIAHTLETFLNHGEIDYIQVVIGAEHGALYDQSIAGLTLPPPVTGGSSRQISVFNGLKALADKGFDKVLIHDAARCFASPELISTVISAISEETPGVVPGLAVSDTLKRYQSGRKMETVPRDNLFQVQTPQGFRFSAILAAHEQAAAADIDGLTDDAAVAEAAGHSINLVAGHGDNVKLTTGQDITKAKLKFMREQFDNLLDIRVGHGYDVHAFEPGDHVILCGVKIIHTQKLKGHSDADVAMHALTDALLGAIGEGDIGKHFPPSDDQWKAADSAIFLKKAAALIRSRSGVIANCDVTVICELPKLRPHVEAMRSRLAQIIELDVGRISVKATTSEQLGFTGRQEGIAASATATVRLPLE